ncbi:MAG: C40 family peptidase [Desulfovibrio sp.]|uniref:C40 family peptidase n=1 Tax=Desulfovibrio sp. TaxID=885 RepID=UPI0039E24589
MGKCLKLCALMMGCILAFGCAAKNSPREDSINSIHAERFRRSYEAAFDSNQQESGQQLLRKARSAIGTPYVRGGTSPDGFDCSGFVCWTYKSVGVQLPRTAREQSVIGQRITNVEDMRAGDIVAFRHPRRGYHTGIYVGDGKFIHSPRKRTSVRINSLDDPYFKNTFLGARRVKVDGSETMVAQAESRLNDFTEERVVRELSRDKKKAGKSAARGSKRDDSRDDSRDKKKDKVVQVASNDKKSSSVNRQQSSASAKSSKTSAQSSSNKSSAQSGSSKSSAQSGSGKSSAQASSSKGSADKDKASKSSKPSSQKAESKKSDTKKSAPDKVATKAEPKGKKDQPKGKGGNS